MNIYYKQLMESIIMYIQINALKFLLGDCPKVGLLGKMGRMLFIVSIKFNILIFRKRVAALGSDHIRKLTSEWGNSLAGPTTGQGN